MRNTAADRRSCKRVILFFLIAGWLPAAITTRAETLALHTFTGESTAAAVTSPSLFASTFGLSSGALEFGYAQEDTWTGSGVPYAQGSGGWAAAHPDAAKHFSATLTAVPGASFTVTNIRFLARSTAQGPSAIGVSINGALLHETNAPANSTFAVHFPVSGFADLTTAEIRILGWDNGSRSSSGGGLLHIDDVLTGGDTAAAPPGGGTQDAIRVRVATFNVEHGLGEPGLESPGSGQYEAVKAVLRRIDPDIIGFQEMMVSHFDHWYELADELDYPYVAIGAAGEFDSMRQGYFSRYPIVSTHNVQSPSGAKELVRAPFRAVVEVPGAATPLVLWNMHHKAMGDNASRFRRAVEAIRIVQDIDAYRAANPLHDAFLFMGDLNEWATSGQPEQFNALPSGLPGSYQLGADIAFPVPYSLFPDDRYRDAGGGMTLLEAYRTGTTDNRCFSSSRLSHIFLSDALFSGSMGAPGGEIYFSGTDDSSGLPKSGDPLPSGTSWTASDHLPIYTDIYLAAIPPPDGIPTWWRMQYFGHPEPRDDGDCRAEDDPDGNGMTNWEEYIAGTDPLSADSTFRAIIEPDASISFLSATGRLYTIEYRDGLDSDDVWQTVDGFEDVPGTGETIMHILPEGDGGDMRFYRLRVRLAL